MHRAQNVGRLNKIAMMLIAVVGVFAVAGGKAHAAPYDITPYVVPSGEREVSFIATSADGNVWFVERENDKLAKIDAITGAITEFDVPDIGADCGGLTDGPDDTMWYIKGSEKIVSRWDIATSTAIDFALPDVGGGCYSGLINGPDGNMWFTHESGKVGKVTPAGTVTMYDTPNGEAGMQLTIGSDNNIWFNDVINGSLVKVTTGGVMTVYPFPLGMSEGLGAVADAVGNIWVSSFEDKIAKFNINSTEFTVYDTPADTFPMYLSLGGDGNVWFGSAGGKGFGRVTLSGEVTLYGLPNETPDEPIAMFSVATGSYGNLFGISYPHGSETTPGTVYKMELPGSQLSVLGASEDCSQIQLVSGATSTGILDLKKLDKSDIPSDGSRSYVTSLADYEITVPSGSTQTVRLVFQTCQRPGQVSARKYSNRTKKFMTIPGAQITQTSLNGQSALLLTYDITDGGPLDDDGQVNGTIVDPVGLASGSDDAVAPNTGSSPASSLAVTIASFFGILALGYAVKKRA